MRQPIWIWMLLLATPLVAGGGYLLSQRSSGGIEADQGPARPITVPVSRGNVDKTVTAPGRLVGLEEGYLSFPAGGRVETLLVRPGSPIRAGATLATLETAPLEEALRRAEIRLEQARLAFEEALGAAALAAAGNEARINSTRAQVPTLTDAELRLAASRDAENRALAEYQKALDRPWEPEQIRESYRLAYEAEKRARQLAEADLEAVKRQQRSAAHFRWACAGMPSSRSRPAWPKGTRWWPNERNECPAADRSGPPEPALPAGWGRNSSAG